MQAARPAALPAGPNRGPPPLPSPTAPLACICCTSAARCSSLSPSITGLAASIAPPSATRTYTSPAAPPATASSAAGAHSSGRWRWRAGRRQGWRRVQHPAKTCEHAGPCCSQARGGWQEAGPCPWLHPPPGRHSLETSPLGLTLALETCRPSGTRMPFTIPPAATAPANTLRQRQSSRGRGRAAEGIRNAATRGEHPQLVAIHPSSASATTHKQHHARLPPPPHTHTHSPEAALPHCLSHFSHLQPKPKVRLVCSSQGQPRAGTSNKSKAAGSERQQQGSEAGTARWGSRRKGPGQLPGQRSSSSPPPVAPAVPQPSPCRSQPLPGPACRRLTRGILGHGLCIAEPLEGRRHIHARHLQRHRRGRRAAAPAQRWRAETQAQGMG